MKTLAYFLMFFILFGCVQPQEERTVVGNETQILIDTVQIYACYSSEKLVKAWIAEFQKINPQFNCKLTLNESSFCISALQESSHISFISRALLDDEEKLINCILPVAKHGLVLIVNEKNPYISIIKNGLKIESLQKVYKENSWYAIANANENPIHFYYRIPGAGNTDNFLDFLDLTPDDLSGELVETDIDLVNAVKDDPYGLGYCSHINAYDNKSNAQAEGIFVVPLKDNFGMAHRFYDSLSLMKRAIWAGKYQCHLYPTLYLVTKEKPHDENIKAFLRWVITEGQEIVDKEGYVKLRSGEIGWTELMI